MKTLRRNPVRHPIIRFLMLTLASLPLLSFTCVDMAERVLIESFFNAVTATANENLQAYYGLSGDRVITP